jgi:hypothetical protein
MHSSSISSSFTSSKFFTINNAFVQTFYFANEHSIGNAFPEPFIFTFSISFL